MIIIKKWKGILNISQNVITKSISKEQVVYPNGITKEDKYFIGITTTEGKTPIIYHSRVLTEEDVVHELLHLKFPKLTQDNVNELTDILLNINKQKIMTIKT